MVGDYGLRRGPGAQANLQASAVIGATISTPAIRHKQPRLPPPCILPGRTLVQSTFLIVMILLLLRKQNHSRHVIPRTKRGRGRLLPVGFADEPHVGSPRRQDTTTFSAAQRQHDAKGTHAERTRTPIARTSHAQYQGHLLRREELQEEDLRPKQYSTNPTILRRPEKVKKNADRGAFFRIPPLCKRNTAFTLGRSLINAASLWHNNVIRQVVVGHGSRGRAG